MRDAHRLKEKYEVSLDNRQVFFLFFGGAVAACLVFVVGVMVGKRLEARKMKKARPAADELALIDRDAKATQTRLTFHDELIKPDSRARKDVPPEVLEWRHMGQVRETKANVVAMNDAAKPAARKDRLDGAARGRASASAPAPAANRRPAQKRYTLQAGAYKSKAEADQMLKKLQSEGYRPYIVAANLKRKGVWYRVRVGSFDSWQQALHAKQKFEEKINMTAYVSRR